MNVGIQLFWIIITSVITFFLGLLLDVLLPEKYRIKFQLRKKKLSKWIKNPSYLIGISSRLDFKEKINLDAVKKQLDQIFADKRPTFRGSEIHFKSTRDNADIAVQIAYEENETEGLIQAYSLNITVNSKTKYRDLRNQIYDLRASLDETEKEIIRELNLFPARRTLYVEIEYLEEFSEILENLKAEQITGMVKETNIKFVYYGNKLTIEDTIDSKTLEWFKNIIAYVG